MFKPARMTRVLIGGHRSRMEDAIRVLHKEKAMHLEDFQDSTGTTSIGTPLEAGDQASELLLRSRGLLKALDAEDVKGRAIPADDAASILADAEAELGPIIKEASDLRNEVNSLQTEIQLLQPFMGIGADLGALLSLTSVEGFVGTVRDDPTEKLAGMRCEIDIDGNAIVVAAAKDAVRDVERILGECGFSAIHVPADITGTAAERSEDVQAKIGRAEERLERAEQRIQGHREQWAPRLAGLERQLSARVQQTQAPLSFGVTETTFHIEGWIPVDRANRVQNAIAAKLGDNVYFELLGDAPSGDGHHPSAQDEAPILLQNKGLAKPYEFMLGLLGKPRYNEIDPTKLMLIFFPLFFGLMVGDVIVGLAIMAFGLYLKKNHIFGIGGPSVGRALFMGGFMAVIVGLFVFGEGLGIHFVVSDEALEHGEMSWEAVIYGKEAVLAHEAGFPTEGFIHKEVSHGHSSTDAAGDHAMDADGGTMEACGGGSYHTMPDGSVMCDDAMDNGTMEPAGNSTGSMTTMATSTEEHGGGGLGGMLAPHGTVHLKAGDVQLGFYSKIHDIQALLTWCILIAVVHLNLAFLLGIRNVAVGHGITLAIQEKLSWITAQIGLGIAVWGWAFHGPAYALGLGIAVFIISMGLLWKGVEKALGAPGFVALLEFLGFFGNILSYTRLAAIGASKAGMALAFAAIGFDVVGGGDIQSIAGWIVYIIGMVVITLLAILSGGLQSLRLQFVEFFQKFYEGGGRAYNPFGRRAQ